MTSMIVPIQQETPRLEGPMMTPRTLLTSLILATAAVGISGIGSMPPAARADAAPDDGLHIERTFKIKAGRMCELRLSSPDKVRKWHLHGHWTCKGVSAEIDGATDDTLVHFVLRGPDDKVIEQRNHPTSGNFSVNYDEPGTYTFVFDNSGIIRSSSREVEFEGRFDPK
jgi:hypothetical protein